MEFKEILAEVTQWVQRDKRLSRSAIKRQFDIDDEYVDDLFDSLTYSQPIETDDRGIVWTGSQEPLDHTGQEAVGVTQVRAERRHLTVMFCDLADSTVLSRFLDPEDLRAVIRQYQQKAAESVIGMGGHVAQYLGDGLLIYFGWPRAHEDDPIRAVFSAIDIVHAVQGDLNPILYREHKVELSVRIGIHSGLAIVGEMGGHGRYENLATGDTVNIAARIEAKASPNSVVVSDVTAKLIAKHFKLKDLGFHRFKGVKEPINILEVLGPSSTQSTINTEDETIGYDQVGREEEMGLLHRCWNEVRLGRGRVVLVSGIAGIGKSTLVNHLRRTISQEGNSCLTIKCSSYHQNSVLYPVARLIERTLGLEGPGTDSEKVARIYRDLEELGLSSRDLAPLLAKLLSYEDPDQPAEYRSTTPQRLKQLIFDATVSWLFAMAMRRPMFVAWEDLHWADPSTLELIGMVLEQTPTVPLLSVMTYRSEFVPQWRQRSHITPITLNRLEQVHAKAMIANLAGNKALPIEVVDHIVKKTDGVPLFVEELTKMILDAGILMEKEGTYELTGPLSSVAIPSTLQDSLLARLDQLNTAKEIAQIASVHGREFPYSVIKAIFPGDISTLNEGLMQLVEAELLYIRGRIPDAVFIFKHALLQDAAYATLLKATRQNFHKKIAANLEQVYPETVQNQPEVLAHHLAEGNDHIRAIEYWLIAAKLARSNSSHLEAIAHASKGLQCAEHIIDPGQRKKYQLKLYLELGPSVLATKGYADPANGEVYQNAKRLGLELNDHEAMYVALWGLTSFHLVRAEHDAALRLAEEMKSNIQDSDDPYYTATVHANGMPLFCLSRFQESAEEFEKGVSSYSSEVNDTQIKFFGLDFGVFCRSFGAPVVWQIGKLDMAMNWADESLELAQKLVHPFSKSLSHAYASLTYQLFGNIETTQRLAARAVAVSAEQKFPYYHGWGLILHGWATGLLGNHQMGLAQIKEGMKILSDTGSRRSFPYYYSLESAVHADQGNIDAALRSIETGLENATEIKEYWWQAELMRMKGEYLHRQSDSNGRADLAHTCLLRAIEISESQSAVMQQIRAQSGLLESGLVDNKAHLILHSDALKELLNSVQGGENTTDILRGHRVLDQIQEQLA